MQFARYEPVIIAVPTTAFDAAKSMQL